MKAYHIFILIAGGILCVGLLATKAKVDFRVGINEPDWNLRHFLQVNSFKGTIHFPAGYSHYAIAPIFLVDGKPIKTGSLDTDTVVKKLDYELLFGKLNDSYQATLALNPGNGSSSQMSIRDREDIIANLNHVSNLGNNEIFSYPALGDFYILGFASSNFDHQGNDYGTAHGDFHIEIGKKKHALALGVAIYKSQADLEAAVPSLLFE